MLGNGCVMGGEGGVKSVCRSGVLVLWHICCAVYGCSSYGYQSPMHCLSMPCTPDLLLEAKARGISRSCPVLVLCVWSSSFFISISSSLDHAAASLLPFIHTPPLSWFSQMHQFTFGCSSIPFVPSESFTAILFLLTRIIQNVDNNKK